MIYFIYLQHSCPAETAENDFHRKLIYLCKIYDSPPGIVGMIISMKIWDHLLKRIQISNAISLNSDEQ